LPAQYTVRSWSVYRDCFWNIAGRPWVYGDSRKWRILYDANRTKLPEPGNPDLILPGMILDIPSIQGETRRGMWNEKTEYPSFR
jgi:nucleoid-associated protein YgaU